MPNTLVINRVQLKAMRRPMMSDPMPQKKLPKHRPRNRELVVYRTVFSETPNSAEREGRMRETPWRRSARQVAYHEDPARRAEPKRVRVCEHELGGQHHTHLHP